MRYSAGGGSHDGAPVALGVVRLEVSELDRVDGSSPAIVRGDG